MDGILPAAVHTGASGRRVGQAEIIGIDQHRIKFFHGVGGRGVGKAARLSTAPHNPELTAQREVIDPVADLLPEAQPDFEVAPEPQRAVEDER